MTMGPSRPGKSGACGSWSAVIRSAWLAMTRPGLFGSRRGRRCDRTVRRDSSRGSRCSGGRGPRTSEEVGVVPAPARARGDSASLRLFHGTYVSTRSWRSFAVVCLGRHRKRKAEFAPPVQPTFRFRLFDTVAWFHSDRRGGLDSSQQRRSDRTVVHVSASHLSRAGRRCTRRSSTMCWRGSARSTGWSPPPTQGVAVPSERPPRPGRRPRPPVRRGRRGPCRTERPGAYQFYPGLGPTIGRRRSLLAIMRQLTLRPSSGVDTAASRGSTAAPFRRVAQPASRGVGHQLENLASSHGATRPSPGLRRGRWRWVGGAPTVVSLPDVVGRVPQSRRRPACSCPAMCRTRTSWCRLRTWSLAVYVEGVRGWIVVGKHWMSTRARRSNAASRPKGAR